MTSAIHLTGCLTERLRAGVAIVYRNRTCSTTFTLERMRSAAHHKAQVMQARQRATTLLAQTPSAKVLHLAEVSTPPDVLSSHWQNFIRIDEPTGEVWRDDGDLTGRNTWITDILAPFSFPIRATLFLLPITIDIEITQPGWLLEVYDQLQSFDLVLLVEGKNLVAFSDDEQGLRCLFVPQGAAQQDC